MTFISTAGQVGGLVSITGQVSCDVSTTGQVSGLVSTAGQVSCDISTTGQVSGLVSTAGQVSCFVQYAKSMLYKVQGSHGCRSPEI